MPVVATATALYFLFGGSRTTPGFLAPGPLRKALAKKLDAGEARDRALALADELVQLADDYDAEILAQLDRFAEAVREESWDAAAAERFLEPLTRRRARTLEEVLRLREAMIEALPARAWRKVFGD